MSAAEYDTLRWVLEMARKDKVRWMEKVHEATTTSTRLSLLYTAVERLHASVERADLLEAIDDIVVNLIGAEKVAVFENNVDGGIVGETIASGKLFVREDDPKRPGLPLEEEMTACVPLRIGCRPKGAIAIYGAKKFSAMDRELLGVLARHAAIVLSVATLQA